MATVGVKGLSLQWFSEPLRWQSFTQNLLRLTTHRFVSFLATGVVIVPIPEGMARPSCPLLTRLDVHAQNGDVIRLLLQRRRQRRLMHSLLPVSWKRDGTFTIAHQESYRSHGAVSDYCILELTQHYYPYCCCWCCVSLPTSIVRRPDVKLVVVINHVLCKEFV